MQVMLNQRKGYDVTSFRSYDQNWGTPQCCFRCENRKNNELCGGIRLLLARAWFQLAKFMVSVCLGRKSNLKSMVYIQSPAADFHSETKDVVVSYFSLLPVQDKIKHRSLTLSSASSSSRNTFKEDEQIPRYKRKEARITVCYPQAGISKPSQAKHEHEKKDTPKESSVPSDSDESNDENEYQDFIDSGRNHRAKVQSRKTKTYARSLSCDERNLLKKYSLSTHDNGNGTFVEKGLVPGKTSYARARSVSPMRPSSLEVEPVYPYRYGIPSDRISLQTVNEAKKKESGKSKPADVTGSPEKADTPKQFASENKPRKKTSPKHKKQKESGRQSVSSANSDWETENGSYFSGTGEAVSVLDWQDEQVQTLVDQHVLSPVALPLKHAIETQVKEGTVNRNLSGDMKTGLANRNLNGSWNSWRSSGHSPTRCLTPQSEVAQMLAALGDQIQQEYGHILNAAVNNVVALPEEEVTYNTLKDVVRRRGLIKRNVQGWKRAAMVLTFCKELAMAMLSSGRGISNVIDCTVRLLEDSVADFVIKNGGWSAIQDLDLTPPQLLSPVSSLLEDASEDGILQEDDLVDAAAAGTEPAAAVAGGDAAFVRSRHASSNRDQHFNETLAKMKSEEPESRDSLENVRLELWLMRQISEQYDRENRDRQRQWSPFTKAAVVVMGLVLLGGAFVYVQRKGNPSQL